MIERMEGEQMARKVKIVSASKSAGSMRLSEAAAKEWRKTVDESKNSERKDSERKVVFS